MAQYNTRINLQAATFPLLSQQSARTIIAPQYDQTYVPGVNADGGAPTTLAANAPIRFKYRASNTTWYPD